MSKYFQQGFILLFLITLTSCGTQKSSTNEFKVNSKLNSEYNESKKSFSGQLNFSDYAAIKSDIEKELNVEIPYGKTILINYMQKAPNCISAKFNSDEIPTFTDKGVQISKTVSSNNNTVDYFAFSNDSFYSNYYKERKDFHLDSGFFYEKVFTLHENCRAFIAIKPNGDFLKHYGEDYYTEVRIFLENVN